MHEIIQMLTGGLEVSSPAGLAASAWKASPGRWVPATPVRCWKYKPSRYNGCESQQSTSCQVLRGEAEARRLTELSKKQGHPVVQKTKSRVFRSQDQVSHNGSQSCALSFRLCSKVGGQNPASSVPGGCHPNTPIPPRPGPAGICLCP